METSAPEWRNRAGNHACEPAAIGYPGTDAEVAALVKQAAAQGQRVKVAGAGDSCNDVACTDGLMIRLGRYGRVLEIDRERSHVVVQAGIRVRKLNESLAARGLGMRNLPNIARQSIGGAISTGGHGTGAAFGGLATEVAGLDLIAADGSLISCSAAEEPDVFAVARVGVGAVGVLSTVTLKCVPAFSLHVVEEAAPLEEVLGHLDEQVAGNDHFEFLWVPHTRWALTKRSNRTDEPVGGRNRPAGWWDRVMAERVAFAVRCRVGGLWPSRFPALGNLLRGATRAEYVDRSYRVFTRHRYVHLYEMEYSIPRGELVGALRRVTDWVDGNGAAANLPVEVRFSAGDDLPLSAATGRPTAHVTVQVYRGTPHHPYFRAVEGIMDTVGGRPHWAKLHDQTATTLAPKYPEWDRWQGVRRRLDPKGRFANAYTDRVLGPVA